MQAKTPLLDKNGQPFSNHKSFHLARHFSTESRTNDADIFDAEGATSTSIIVYKSAEIDEVAHVCVATRAAGFSLRNKLRPTTARQIAQALIAAADLCDEFDAAQTMAEERAIAAHEAADEASAQVPA